MLRFSILNKFFSAKNCMMFSISIFFINTCFANHTHHRHHKIHYASQTITTTTVTTIPKPKKRIVDLVNKTVDTLNYSKYKFGGTHYDSSKGVYIVDCSSFVDHLLAKVNKRAYKNLVNSTGSYSPNTQTYYDFFKKLSQRNNQYWNKIEDVAKLQAGDILVFRKTSSANPTGHIMVIMKKPIQKTDTYQIQVADSAPVGHSHDTRLPHVSGIGIGTLLLKVNLKTGKPYAYAWREGSYFKHNIRFAMARPVDFRS